MKLACYDMMLDQIHLTKKVDILHDPGFRERILPLYYSIDVGGYSVIVHTHNKGMYVCMASVS